MTQPQMIHLWVLLSSPYRNQPLRANLQIHALNALPAPYEAIVYKSPGEIEHFRDEHVLLTTNEVPDDTPLRIGEDLYAALLDLRFANLPRLLWIEALDPSGKLNYAEEFACSNQIRVHLGSQEDDSDLAMQYLQHVAIAADTLLGTSEKLCEVMALGTDEIQLAPEPTDEVVRAVLKLFFRPWFLQASRPSYLASDQKMLLVCGHLECHWCAPYFARLEFRRWNINVEQFIGNSRAAMDLVYDIMSHRARKLVGDENLPAYVPPHPEEHRDHDFIFGIELEMLVKLKDVSHAQQAAPDWREFTTRLCDFLTERGINAQFFPRSETRNLSYYCDSYDGRWIVTNDNSIQDTAFNQTAPGSQNQEYGLEFVSSKRYPNWGEACFHLSSELWSHLDAGVHIIKTGAAYLSCGTHIHMSVAGAFASVRAGQPYESMAQLAKAVVYYERCIDSIMPPHRRNNKWCRSNRWNSVLQFRELDQILYAIDAIGWNSDDPDDPDNSANFEKLAELMCPPLENGKRRYYRWNFMGLLQTDPGRRTIEFRQPPGATSEVEAEVWPKFMLAFIQGALLDPPGIFIQELKNSSYPEVRLTPNEATKLATVAIEGRYATMGRFAKMLEIGCNSVHGVSFSDIQHLLTVQKLDEGPEPEHVFVAADAPRVESKEESAPLMGSLMLAASQTPLQGIIGVPTDQLDAVVPPLWG